MSTCGSRRMSARTSCDDIWNATTSVCGIVRALLPAGKLDQIANEATSRLAARPRLEELRSRLGIDLDAAGQNVDVGPETRQWCSQLMRGIGDELALSELGALKRGQDRLRLTASC